MKTMAISEFKTHCLQVLGRVARSKETVVVTKRGKPLREQKGPFYFFEKTRMSP